MRVSRSVPREFEKYSAPGRFRAVRALRSAMLELKTSSVLSDSCKEEMKVVYEQNLMLQKIFYEAHLDYDSALMQLRLILEPVAFKGPRTQVVTFMDEGDGSTGKGTLRELCDECLGLHSGGLQRGYSAVLKQETLVVRKNEGPSEQLSNVNQCRHAWVDDFAPTVPLSTAVLRQLSGGNNITAARKNAKELAFKFTGQLFLAANGPWKPDEPWKGADVRRITGLNFEVRFVDVPQGQNELAKDSTIKRQISSFFSAFWYFALAFHLLEQPLDKSDYTEPKPPNTLAMIKLLQRKSDEDEGPTIEDVEAFSADKLIQYTLGVAKPSSSSDVQEVFCQWAKTRGKGDVTIVQAKQVLGLKFFSKTGYTLKAVLGRAKTTVNVYLINELPWTLKP